jgi:hypothetical protein
MDCVQRLEARGFDWVPHRTRSERMHAKISSIPCQLAAPVEHPRGEKSGRVERPQDSIVACAYEAFTDAPRITNTSQS